MKQSTGHTALSQIIKNMEPILHEGAYVFVSVADIESIPRSVTICEMKEKEGVTVIISKEEAEKRGLPFTYVASWITLNIHSSLEAVGLTAAFSTALAKQGISCNVVAGYYHDHIFVAKKEELLAMEVLKGMTKEHP